jgi:segregation and condensation protein B
MTRKSAPPADAPQGDLGLATFRQLPDEAGLSLNQLSAALAGMLRSGDDPYAAPEEVEASAAPAEADPDAGCEVAPRSILEAMLFVGSPQNEPLAARQVAGMMRGVRPAEIDALVRELNRDYQARACPYHIVAEGAGYRLTLREDFARMRDLFYGKSRQARLSQSAVELLSAVAYRPGISAEELSKLRGQPCGHTLSQLVRRGLVRLEREESKRRQARYFTTDRFLKLFGLTSLDELPRSDDLEAV